MVTCTLCNGFGVTSQWVVEYQSSKRCTNCDGVGKVPVVAGWRPFEVTKETVQAGSEYNNCNLHRDCDAADLKARKEGRERASHCWSDDCEDCFGC